MVKTNTAPVELPPSYNDLNLKTNNLNFKEIEQQKPGKTQDLTQI